MSSIFGKNILIAIPHPDDEIVACAAAIDRARAGDAKIFALYLTHGCIARDVMWPWLRPAYEFAIARRRAEAEAVAHLYNIAPVGWMRRPARYLWRQLVDVQEEIETAIEQHAIDQLWVPAYEGGNADHDGLNAIGSVLGKRLSVVEFAEYNFYGCRAHSQAFPFPNGSEQTIALTPREKEKKRAALQLYHSEKGNLNYVQCERECYRPLAAANYNHPPHEGKLWYARFQWVPFRHPRVDFTKPEDVSAAIEEYLRENKKK